MSGKKLLDFWLKMQTYCILTILEIMNIFSNSVLYKSSAGEE